MMPQDRRAVRDSLMSISNIVIGILIAWFIIKGIERFADMLGGSKKDETENTKPGKPSE